MATICERRATRGGRDERLCELLALHFHPEHGSRYWLRRQEALGWDVRDRVRSADDLWRLGPTPAHDLRRHPVRDFIPRALHGQLRRFVLGETAGTRGEPCATTYRDDEFQAAFIAPFLAVARATGVPRGEPWLWVGPSGPHVIGKAVRELARQTGSMDPFSVDFDPRWAKQLADGSLARRRYLDHVTAQALDVLEREAVGVLFTTPPALAALVPRMTDRRREAIHGVHYGGLSLTAAALNEFRAAFPNAVHLSGYGNTLFGVLMEVADGPRQALDYFPPADRLRFHVVAWPGDATTPAWPPRACEPGETGRVLFHRLDESCLLVGVVERDEAERALALKRDFLVPCAYHFYRRPPVLVRGEGAYLFDADGRAYLDAFSGVSVVNAGHCNPEIVSAAVEQMGRLQHTTTVYLTEPMLELAHTIAELTPAGLRRSFFCASGSEANEGALLLATLATGRSECAYLTGGLHGRTKWAMSVTGLDMWRTDPQPLVTAHAIPGPRHPESLPALERLLRRETFAAVIAEPVQGNGGIVVPPADYWPELRRLCSRYGTLLVADEVQTAWNRTGRWFATQHWGVTPDVVTVAKALGNGLPIAAFVTTDAVAAHGTRPGAATFGGNLVSCQAALATLRYHQRHELGRRSAELGARLRRHLEELSRRHPALAEVRGLGLMIGAELRDSQGRPAAALTDDVLEEMKDAGYLLGKTGPGRNVLTFLPPLVVEPEALDGLAERLDAVLARHR